MKKFKQFFISLCMILGLTTLTSCGNGGTPYENVGLAAAFGHVASTGSYWAGIAFAIVLCAGIVYAMYQSYQKGGDINIVLVALVVAILMFAVMMRPCELAVNTTVEQAARGVWIGY